ncbi:MAG: MarR family transcriptional regulator [Gammaproteobacteria bacterium]
MVEFRTAQEAAAHPVVSLLRELTHTYHAFSLCESTHLRHTGLTQSQAEVIFALGQAGAQSCKDLGGRALITKGTLTGILDRLERRGWITRRPSRSDRRVMIVSLSPEGQTLFETTYPGYVAELAERAEGCTAPEDLQIRQALQKLRTLFDD